MRNMQWTFGNKRTLPPARWTKPYASRVSYSAKFSLLYKAKRPIARIFIADSKSDLFEVSGNFAFFLGLLSTISLLVA